MFDLVLAFFVGFVAGVFYTALLAANEEKKREDDKE
jgi:hypothetical protein